MPNWTIYKHGVELPEDAVGIYTAWRNDFAAKAMATLNALDGINFIMRETADESGVDFFVPADKKQACIDAMKSAGVPG